MTEYTVTSITEDNETVTRVWHADDTDHAREQHEDAFPEELFVSAEKAHSHDA